MKHAFSLSKKMTWLPDKQMVIGLLFESTKYRNKEMFNLYADNKVKENIGDEYCPTFKSEKCVKVSNKNFFSFCDSII